jgi:hypothetical protein
MLPFGASAVAVFYDYCMEKDALWLGPTLRITGSKKQSDEERGAVLFTVRVHAIVM